MIISIEGMDGVGKTTVAKRIEKDLNYKYIKNPIKELLEIDDAEFLRISEKIFNNSDYKIKTWYSALGDIYALEKYRNENIIMDRHILLNYFFNGDKITEDIFKVQVNIFGKPDLTIVLVASPETRIKRIIGRNPNDPDLLDERIRKYGYDKMIEFLKRYNYNYAIVDTEKLSKEQVLEKCKKLILEMQLETRQKNIYLKDEKIDTIVNNDYKLIKKQLIKKH